jgi:hypothetical protein
MPASLMLCFAFNLLLCFLLQASASVMYQCYKCDAEMTLWLGREDDTWMQNFKPNPDVFRCSGRCQRLWHKKFDSTANKLKQPAVFRKLRSLLFVHLLTLHISVFLAFASLLCCTCSCVLMSDKYMEDGVTVECFAQGAGNTFKCPTCVAGKFPNPPPQ